MIINDEPSPITRLRTEAIKMTLSSLYTLRSYIKRHAYFVAAGAVIVVGSLHIAHTVSSHEEKPVAPIESQRYNACVFGKDITTEGSDTIALMDVDADCVQLSRSGKVAEPEERALAQEIALMLEGHPMEVMAEHIAQKDKKVAGLIVGIARQESQWGKHAPSKAGVDCYNYWGYKTGSSRYDCKASRLFRL